jgi:hypothetical protein
MAFDTCLYIWIIIPTYTIRNRIQLVASLGNYPRTCRLVSKKRSGGIRGKSWGRIELKVEVSHGVFFPVLSSVHIRRQQEERKLTTSWSSLLPLLGPSSFHHPHPCHSHRRASHRTSRYTPRHPSRSGDGTALKAWVIPGR